MSTLGKIVAGLWMRPKLLLLCLGVIVLITGIAVVRGRYILRGPLELATKKRQFRALLKTNDHRAVAEAAIAAIRAYTNAQFLHNEVTNLGPAIATLRPSYVDVYPDSVTIELAGGFDHFGFKIEDRDESWDMSWYTEKGRKPLLSIAKGEPDDTP